jgi:hypothetical protein
MCGSDFTRAVGRPDVSRGMETYNVAANGRFDGMTALIKSGASGIGLAVTGRVIAEGGLVTLWASDEPP